MRGTAKENTFRGSKSMVVIIAAGIAGAIVFGLVGVKVLFPSAPSDEWFVGKGAHKGMFVVYQLQQLDTNNDRPFKMMIYFKDQDSNGNWIAPVWIQDQGKTMNATLKLSSISLSPLATGNTSQEMSPYLDAYSNSLGWISAFANAAQPQSLSSAYWGKIANIGGAPISPTGTERIIEPAGAFNTTVVGWHKGLDNKIWIVQDFPYPVKALTYAEVTSGQPPILFAFDLLRAGTGNPPAPS